MSTGSEPTSWKTNTASFDIGNESTVLLDAIPITKLTLSPIPNINFAERELSLAIEGTWDGFPSSITEIPATLTWLIEVREPEQAQNEIGVRGTLTLKRGRQNHWEFKVNRRPPTLNMVKHRLYGKGSVGFRIQAEFPHTPPVETTTNPIAFNHPLNVTYEITEAKIGGEVTFKLQADGAPASLLEEGAVVRVTVSESSDGKASADKLRARGPTTELLWTAATRSAPLTTQLGFAAGAFRDFDENDKDGLDYTFSVQLQLPNTNRFINALTPVPLPKIARPSLQAFSLELCPTSDDWRGYPSIVATGIIDGFAPKAEVRIELDLWRTDRHGILRSCLPSGPVTCFLGKNGGFREELYTFPMAREEESEDDEVVAIAMSPAPHTPTSAAVANARAGAAHQGGGGTASAAAPRLLATLRFSDDTVSNTKAPLSVFLNYDAETFASFNEKLAGLCLPQKARWVCSAEAKNAEVFIAKLKQFVTRIYPTLTSASATARGERNRP